MDREHSSRAVLVADDEQILLDAIDRVIRRWLGCKVVTCGDGDEVLRQLGERSFDAVITDMLMPGCHGFDLIRGARETRPDCDVIVMTAYPHEFPYVEVIRAGASDFIAKPHSPEELCAKIIRVFHERELREKVLTEKERITADLESARALHSPQQRGDERYGMLFEMSMNGMLVLQPDQCLVEDVNRSFCEMSGRTREGLLHTSLYDVLVEADRERFGIGLGMIEKNKRGALSDIRLSHTSGQDIWLDMSLTFIRDESEDILLLACMDVTEQRKIEDQLVEMASTDELTGLFNQRSFFSRLEAAINAAVMEKTAVSLVLMDLDDFKRCNDTHGHQVGDRLLRTVGELIQRQIRKNDEGFRYGGDEFAVILKGATGQASMNAVARMQKDFMEQERRETSLSFGIAEYREGMDSKGLMKAADEALYRAKSAGKNTVELA